MIRPAVRVLGIDTSLRSAGFGIVEAAGSRMVAVAYGTIRNPASLPLSASLKRLAEEIAAAAERSRPTAAAVEGVFYCKNVRTTLALGEARGAVIATCARLGLPVFEYAPRRVKQAVVGFGGASKEQMVRMVSTLLALREAPGEDEADALGIAICHLHHAARHALLAPEPI